MSASEYEDKQEDMSEFDMEATFSGSVTNELDDVDMCDITSGQRGQCDIDTNDKLSENASHSFEGDTEQDADTNVQFGPESI